MQSERPLAIVSAPLPDDLRAMLEQSADTVDVPTGQPPGDSVAAGLRDKVRGIVCTMRTRIDSAVFDAFPNLKVVSNFAVGFDNVDVEAATRRNVLVCNTPGVLDGAVADLTFGLILGVARNLVAGDAWVRSGQWAQKGAPGLARDIRGKTLGLLGMGRIGRVVARTARGFDLDVIYHNRRRDSEAESAGLARYRDREALFREADILSVHIPVSDETRGCIGAREFGWMKPTAFLINTARGGVIDEPALVEALRQGTIAGAGLDVMQTEPLPADSPLCSLPNVMLQPHIASATVETRRAMIDLAVRNLQDALAGRQPAAMVNPAVWR